jgi:putative nucleotidyltransferase with HDIG domain
VDAKDSYTRSHCETVSGLCVMIATALGIEKARIEKLRVAGLLHDVGKIGIPDTILQKPGALMEEEFETMKAHSKLGHSIVSGAGLQEEAVWILHHHERPDGRGYPDGLSGDEVPLESRIILCADAFEAITSDRPYRQGRAEHEALVELHRSAGGQFDPDCVAALEAALRVPALA